MIVRWLFAFVAVLIAAVMGMSTYVIARYPISDPLVRLSAVVSNYGLFLIPLGIAGAGLALLARLRGHAVVRWLGALTALVCVVGAAAAVVPLVASWREAQRQGASLSFGEYITAGSNTGSLDPRFGVGYNVVDGRELLLDVKLPSGTSDSPRPAVVWVHGGGWAEGDRAQSPRWHEWLNERGYAVFAIDYRLSPPPRWDQAPADVKCAIGWVKQHAERYGLDPERVVVAGASAGGNLALVAAYSDDRVQPSCAVTDTAVRAVAALYPATDLRAGWHDPDLVAGTRELLRDYTGGTPEQVPERYAAAAPVSYVRPGLPPTLLMHGTRDHVVPHAQSAQLARLLAAAGVAHELLSIPYGEHAYDINWGDWGTQLSRHAFDRFLERHVRSN
ncbi:alpha/beta hydrolase [Nocardia sp. CC201C]|uniref:alpha/beta hydrolase n=1 Tax=Nocardia sp. CC201C TaxID=3044575 RepID=UPI0024A8BC36|nr:alpha/beta hydrolase [Nocardia sp. CC201C]